MDEIKEAFLKVKQDIDSLTETVKKTNENFLETKKRIVELCDVISKLDNKIGEMEIQAQELKNNNLIEDKKKEQETEKTLIQKNHPFLTPFKFEYNFIPKTTGNKEKQTQNNNFQSNMVENKTNNQDIKDRKDQNQGISIGNQGVKTDRQTNQQTNRHIENQLEDALETINSLDNIKKELRRKFKKLTKRELLVFSTIYQLSEEMGHSTYKDIANKLKLSESSIRDYVGRLISKEIPLEKTKINNKEINLKISENLKKIASLSTILHLIDL